MRLTALVVALTLSSLCSAQQYDVLIRNGRVVDGSGNPWIYADVGVIGDRVVLVGRAAESVKAKRTIDATGLVVAPGFIDMLGQSEDVVLVDNRAFSKITQGITTEITGEGDTIAPINDPIIAEQRDWLEHYKVTVDWRNLDEYFRRLERQKIAINLGTYVGATRVRKMVLGNADRAPTPEELRRMQEYVEDAMREGAMGVSSSLIYAPAFYAKTDELIALAKVAARYNGIYATHIRNEADREMEALDEALRIGREANIPVEIFHLKVAGRQNWGRMPQVLEAIEKARAEGVDVTADQYPYVAGATSLSAVIPPKYHEGGREALLKTLRDPAQRRAIRAELEGKTAGENMWRGAGGPEGVMVTSVLDPKLKKYEGRTVAQIAREQNKDPLDGLMDLIIIGNNNIGAVYFTMKEEEVRMAMQRPWVSIGSDYGAVNIEGPLSESKTHPRAWGTFPRILGKYVREEKVLRLEEAIRKFTSLPAQRMKLRDRGLLRPGFYADITIFNPETITDVATFEDPNRPSKGIEYVFVNGVLTVERGKLTGQLGGRPLRGPGYVAQAHAPEGLPPRGKIHGVVTDDEGWPLPRTRVSLSDQSGKKIEEFETRLDGRFEFPGNATCESCLLRADRMGFKPEERRLSYNGANSLWFSFALLRTAGAP
jgi:N-acyl-D-amino-acid deacylase